MRTVLKKSATAVRLHFSKIILRKQLKKKQFNYWFFYPSLFVGHVRWRKREGWLVSCMRRSLPLSTATEVSVSNCWDSAGGSTTERCVSVTRKAGLIGNSKQLSVRLSRRTPLSQQPAKPRGRGLEKSRFHRESSRTSVCQHH